MKTMKCEAIVPITTDMRYPDHKAPAHQCPFDARVKIDHHYFCSRHATIEALGLLVEEKRAFVLPVRPAVIGKRPVLADTKR